MPKSNFTDGNRGQQRTACSCTPYRKSRRAQNARDCETWVESEIANTINLFDLGDVRATTLIVYECTDRNVDS